MPYPGEKNTGGQVWVSTPYQSGPTSTGIITGVWLNDGEDVDWMWTHTPQGSYVSGYTVRSRGFKTPSDTYQISQVEKCYKVVGKNTCQDLGHCTESEKADILLESPDVIFEECDKMESNDDD